MDSRPSRLLVVALVLCGAVLRVAAEDPVAKPVRLHPSVTVDFSTGGFNRALPFDTPFTITGSTNSPAPQRDLGHLFHRRDDLGSASAITSTGRAATSVRHAAHEIVDGRVWATPTLEGTTLYVRNRKYLYAFELG